MNDNKKDDLARLSIDQIPEEYYVSSAFYKGMMYATFLSIQIIHSLFLNLSSLQNSPKK